ncbi:MerR family transcriptional regulator [Amycolatopsis magusensis]|uniref:MerR family transcriptional regulator n=1 Tax=Amycolatopsis magusensis TaxID=882444 RepID=UPI0037B01453
MVTPITVLGIGELARRTGVPVRTVRFYCDEGILEPVRSAGGHRRFDVTAVEQLTLIRRLRGLGLGLPSIRQVLAGQRSVAEAVTAERAALDAELAALAWRRASLRAVETGARLDLLAAVGDGHAAREVLSGFWRNDFLGPAPADTVEMFLASSVPTPPEDPTPAQVVAYAEMVALVDDTKLRTGLRRRPRIADQAALHDGIGVACDLARPLVLAGQRPEPGAALDRFVDAYAVLGRTGDTPEFRRSLHTNLAVERNPRLRRYWELVGEVTGEAVTVGQAHAWLLDALGVQR